MESTSPEILSVQNLTKTYVTYRKEEGLVGGFKALFHRQSIEVPAVRGLNLSIRRGEFVGLLGPNGAGKTTTLKMLTGLIAPTNGSATAFGSYDTAKRPPAYLRRIGMVMGQRNQLNPDLPAMDSFRLAQAIYDIDDARLKRRLDTCLALVEVGELIYSPVRKLSLGERMKMELVLALLHEPELLFLDEPTIGLDFHAAKQIRGFLAETNAKLGVTVVLTSHYTRDIEELCRRVVLINHGAVVYDGALSGVDDRIHGQKTVTLTLRDKKSVETMKTIFGEEAQSVDSGANANVLRFDTPARTTASLLHRVFECIRPELILDLKVGERPLDEIFSEIYRKPLLEGALSHAGKVD